MKKNTGSQTYAVSIIVPIYNCKDRVERCVESIYTQSFSDFEVILVNDGSTDNSLEVCKKLQNRYSQLAVIDKENGGAGSARNAGLQVAKGEYILFVDADDEINKDLLQIVYSKAKEANYDIVVFAIGIIHNGVEDEKKQKLTSTQQRNMELRTQQEFRKEFVNLYYDGVLYGGPCNKLFKRSVIEKNQVFFPNLKRGQDEIFNFRFYRWVESAAVIPDVLYTYYIFDQASANKKYRLNYFETTTITYFRAVRSLLDEFKITDDDSIKRFQYSFVYSMEAAPELAWNPLEKLNKSEKIAFLKKIQNHPFIIETAEEIRFVPKECVEYWKCFIQYDAEKLYRFIVRKKNIQSIKNLVKRCLGRSINTDGIK